MTHVMTPDDTALSRGHRRGKYLPRTTPVEAIVVHTTGAGPVVRMTAAKFAKWRRRNPEAATDPYLAALWVFRNQDPAAHWVVGQGGELALTVPEDECAWHVGGKNSGKYQGDRWDDTGCEWWGQRWWPFNSPRDLAGGRLWAGYEAPVGLRGFKARTIAAYERGSCNANTIGIEVVPPMHNPRGAWSEACWESLVALITDIRYRHDLPMMVDRIITHSDAHPIARTDKGKPWDTTPAQFSFDEYARRCGRFDKLP